MTDEGQHADAMSFEDLLACPHLQFDLRGEVLPHMLAFGPPGVVTSGGTLSATVRVAAPARSLGSRPWLFEPLASTTAGCG